MSERPLRLLITGTGLPIPPTGWGAIEKIVAEQLRFLPPHGIDVTLCNPPGKSNWRRVLQARPWRYDLTLVQLDRHARHWVPMARWLRVPIVCTTHFGYAAFPDRWTKSFRKTFRALLHAPALLALSRPIADVFRARDFAGELHMLPNGVDTDAIRFCTQPGRGAVVLGRIENRKRQPQLAEQLRGAPVTLDLIGPLSSDVPDDFAGNGENVLWRGPWSRADVDTRLTQYAALALLSDGEAHPLAVLEALAAGLSVVVSDEASHNLDRAQPFVYVVDRENPSAVADALSRATTENAAHRRAIRAYVESEFGWKTLAGRYDATLRDIAARLRR